MSLLSQRDRARHMPPLVVAVVLALVCLLQALPWFFPRVNLFERLEWMTYDWRMRLAARFNVAAASCLGVVSIDEDSLHSVNVSYGFSWPWPRQLYGRLVNELNAQGAKVIGFDILFRELQAFDGESAVLIGSEAVPSDDYFAREVKAAGNVVLGAMGETYETQSGREWRVLAPHSKFATNAWRVGHIMGEADSDGVLRRARAYYDDPREGRFWHLGLILAARYLDLDLDRAEVRENKLLIPGRGGTARRVIPVDREGHFYIDWCLLWDDPQVKMVPFQNVLESELKRSAGRTNQGAAWYDKVVVVGSLGQGNNVSDLGTTPLSKQTFLFSKHWNVANSIILNRFIHRSGYLTEAILILLMGVLSGAITWRLRVLHASAVLAAVLFLYVGLGVLLFIQARYWLPLTLPLGGALAMTHVSLVTYRVRVEQRERHRVRTVFSKVVSPDVVNELLQSETLSFGGTRRCVSVYFADIRGFTKMTDEAQARAEAHVRECGMDARESEAYLDAQAREILATVNQYLGIVADTIRRYQGTFDKYIGDCVMAFWGAPTPDEQHAVHCVRAAIEAQRSIYSLNAARAAENQRREQGNRERAARGAPPLPPLTLLALGSGINTGVVTVGLMGSESHILNYTVFGREVNLASRLEGISGRGRILISESTHRDLVRDAPELADKCVALPPVTVKGFREAVHVYEVQWRQVGDAPEAYDTSLVTGSAESPPTEPDAFPTG